MRILVFVQTALPLVFTYSLFPRLTPAGILVFVQTALPLVFTYSDSSRGSIATVAIQWMRYVRAYARGINYWIATPSVMARNDKREGVGQRGNTFMHSLTSMRQCQIEKTTRKRNDDFLFVCLGRMTAYKISWDRLNFNS